VSLEPFGEVYSHKKYMFDNPSDPFQNVIEGIQPEETKQFAYLDSHIRSV